MCFIWTVLRAGLPDWQAVHTPQPIAAKMAMTAPIDTTQNAASSVLRRWGFQARTRFHRLDQSQVKAESVPMDTRNRSTSLAPSQSQYPQETLAQNA